MADQLSFERLVLPHKDAAYNVAYWIVRNRDDAEDVVQDAFLRAYKAFAGFREGEPVRPWLLTITRNVSYRLLEKRRRAATEVPLEIPSGDGEVIHDVELLSSEPDGEARSIAKAEAREIRIALASLPLAYRDVVVLREMEELSYNQIAEILDVPVGTVMSRLSRGRAMLRRALIRARTGK